MEMNEISKGWKEINVIHLMACAHDIVILYPIYKINVVVQILACGMYTRILPHISTILPVTAFRHVN